MSRNNHYDDPVFFAKYGEMARSQLGLAGAGEWRELEKLLPSFAGKAVLDLGCGYGWHCKYAADRGASSVLGVDLSEKMLTVAREKNAHPAITYRQGAMEELSFPDGSFDLVLSSLAFHYVEDLPALEQRISRWLKPGGDFIFSVEHPIFTAEGSQDWFRGADGEILHFPVDNYYYGGRREAIFLGETVIKYHRTLTDHWKALTQAGFQVLDLVEPQPPEEMLDLPGMKDEMRRPMMLLIKAKKL